MSTDKPVIFISHSHADIELAAALEDFVNALTLGTLDVRRSSKRGQIEIGENWREWIESNVVANHLTLVVLTASARRGDWVMWEIGAVRGVEYMNDALPEDHALKQRGNRLWVIGFNLSAGDVSPLASDQSSDGLNVHDMEALAVQLLQRFEGLGGPNPNNEHTKKHALQQAALFVEKATEAVKHSRANPTEALVQTWVDRLDTALNDGAYEWVTSARRWINTVFLGRNKADAHEFIDFRLHERLARGMSQFEKHRASALKQWQLALQDAPNDLVVLREIGGLQRKLKNKDDLDETLREMAELDADVFRYDREAIALKVGRFSDAGDFSGAQRVFDTEADDTIVSRDGYLLNWRAFVTLQASENALKAETIRDAALELYNRLEILMKMRVKPDVWTLANLANAQLALNRDVETLDRTFEALKNAAETPQQLDSAKDHFATIARLVGNDFDWSKALEL